MLTGFSSDIVSQRHSMARYTRNAAAEPVHTPDSTHTYAAAGIDVLLDNQPTGEHNTNGTRSNCFAFNVLANLFQLWGGDRLCSGAIEYYSTISPRGNTTT